MPPARLAWRQTKAELTRSFFQAGVAGQRIGVFSLSRLPERLLRRVISQHNAKIDRITRALLQGETELRQELSIPTYEDFQQRLAVKDQRDQIEAHFRKTRDFEVYRSWLLEEPPIGTHFREVFFRPQFPAFAPERDRRRHTLIVGQSGSGKSELLKLLALRTVSPQGQRHRRRALVLIDPHGDLAEQLARQQCFADDLQQRPTNSNLVYLDPLLGAGRGLFPTLNPLDVAGRGYSELQLEKIAQQLVQVFKSLIARDDYSLTLNMETLLLPCLTVLLHRPDSTFYDLLRFLDDDSSHDLVELGCQSPNPGHRFFFRSSFADRRFDPTKGALSTKVQALLNSQAFAMFLARQNSTLDLEAALNSGKTIILNCAVGRVGNQTGEALGRFMIGMLLAIAFNRAELHQRRRTAIWLFVDEMQRFISDELRIILSEARKYGLHLTLASQVIGQGMNKELTRIVLGNSAVKMLGAAGADSQAVMAKEMGVRREFFADLAVGEFAVKCGTTPPIRVQIDADAIGTRTQMADADWHTLQAAQLERFYRPIASSAAGETTSQPRDELEATELTEEIRASADLAKSVVTIPGEELPRFDDRNPFGDLDDGLSENREGHAEE